MTIHPLNKQVSTIGPEDILPEAIKGVTAFIKRTDRNTTLPYFGTHYSIEDLAMDAVEKVVRANPMYLTKSYVRIAARCVCIDRLTKKKLDQVRIKPTEDDFETSLEDSLIGDTFDHIDHLESLVLPCLSEHQVLLYRALLTGKMYVEIAKDLKLSLRTLERQVRELKWKITFLLTEEDPDLSPNTLNGGTPSN